MVKRSNSRRAMTLFELAVVLVVLGILSFFAYRGATAGQERAQRFDSAIAMQRVVTAETTFARSFGQYTPWPAELSTLGRDVDVVVGKAEIGQVSIAVGTDGSLGVAGLEETSGLCRIFTVPPLGTGMGTLTETTQTEGTCSGEAGLTAGIGPVAYQPVR